MFWVYMTVHRRNLMQYSWGRLVSTCYRTLILYMHGFLMSSVGLLDVNWMGLANLFIMAAVGEDGKWSVVKPVLQNMNKQG